MAKYRRIKYRSIKYRCLNRSCNLLFDKPVEGCCPRCGSDNYEIED